MQTQTNSQTLQAKKIKGIIDQSGKLIITDDLNLKPGEVEVIILQNQTNKEINISESKQKVRESPSQIKALKDWFENTQPVSPDFDEDQARWEALKEKHNL